MPAAVGDSVVLTVNYWDGERPTDGDFLRTSTGRCYRIDEARGHRLRCTVLERDAVAYGEPGVFCWTWGRR